MTPKKASELIDDTAKELDLDPELVDIVVSIYWNEIRKKLSGLEDVRIHMSNLGVFAVRSNKLKELKIKYDRYIEEKENVKTFKRYSYIFDAKLYSERIEKLFEKISQEREKKKQILLKKNGFKDNME